MRCIQNSHLPAQKTCRVRPTKEGGRTPTLAATKEGAASLLGGAERGPRREAEASLQGRESPLGAGPGPIFEARSFWLKLCIGSRQYQPLSLFSLVHFKVMCREARSNS